MPSRRRRWYTRPGRIIPLLLFLALLVATVPPLLAEPTPVVLDPQGQSYAAASGWYAAQVELQEVELLGGLVHIQAEALRKDDAAGPAAAYTWGSIKLPAMLPRELVEERLRDAAIGELRAEGIRVDQVPHKDGAYTENGHDGRLQRYIGTTRGSGLEHIQLDVEIAILTWRCNHLGAFGVAFGVGKTETFETQQDLMEFVDGLVEGTNDPLDPDAILDNGTASDPLEDSADLDAVGTSPYVDEITTHLMPHTVCDA